MREGDVPGLSVALIKDGSVSWHQSFGVRNADTRVPLDDATIFEAASLSKPVFAYAILKLVDQGKLDLDKPLIKYLPERAVPNDERSDLITARMVLDHTTGFQNQVLPKQGLTIYFNPGEKFSYSGEGFLYLQRVVEHVLGEPLEAFMKRTVFIPLEMKKSSYVWNENFETLKANGHKASGVVGEIRRPSAARSSSSLHTTALDYAKFVVAMIHRKGLRKETFDQTFTPQVRLDENCYSCIGKTPGPVSQTLSWGLGWGLEGSSRGYSFWHWGDNNGEFHNFVLASSKEGTGIVIFSNSGNGHSIIPTIVGQATGQSHPAFAWMGYEAYDSPGKIFLRNILERGTLAIRQYVDDRKKAAGSRVLNEAQMNSLGYSLLAKKRISEAIEVFKINVEDFPGSSNAYDSLGEAYMISGNKKLAIENYVKSIELNPGNTNGVEMLKKLRDQK